jgi:hypothetical protein
MYLVLPDMPVTPVVCPILSDQRHYMVLASGWTKTVVDVQRQLLRMRIHHAFGLG